MFTFLHNSSEGMFLCLPEELYILSAFFVSHIHSVWLQTDNQGRIIAKGLMQSFVDNCVGTLHIVPF